MAIFGIDVSMQNGDLDFIQIKAAKVRFALVKATQGHALNSSRYLFEDAKLERNLSGFSKVGIAVGMYHFFTGKSVEECIAEADYFVDTVKAKSHGEPLFLVCGAEAYTNRYLQGLTRYQLTVLVNLFCDRIREAGYKPCVYINNDFANNVIDLSLLNCPLWQAKYGANVCRPRDAGDQLAIHRYTANGLLPGAAGSFGLNFGYERLARRLLLLAGISSETIEIIESCKGGEAMLVQIADKVAEHELKPVRSPDAVKLASLIRWYCGLEVDGMRELLNSDRSGEALREVYTAMLRR